MNEKQMVEMQKHIDALNRENEVIHDYAHESAMKVIKLQDKLRITIGSFIIVLTFLGVWIYALYYANGLLATDNQTKENWKQSAIILDGKYNDLQDDMKVQKKAFYELRKTCTTAQIKKAVKNTPPPPMVKDSK